MFLCALVMIFHLVYGLETKHPRTGKVLPITSLASRQQLSVEYDGFGVSLFFDLG